MILTSMLLWTFSTVAAILYIVLFLFITFICPAWLVSIQPLKKYVYTQTYLEATIQIRYST